MREIKFRGKSKVTNQWVYGDLIHKASFVGIEFDTIGGREYHAVWQVGQYTGLHDKNSKGVYEGDYIEDARGLIHLVFWDENECAFKLDYKYYHHKDKDECHSQLPMYSRKGEVIGNIYENPELLQEVT